MNKNWFIMTRMIALLVFLFAGISYGECTIHTDMYARNDMGTYTLSPYVVGCGFHGCIKGTACGGQPQMTGSCNYDCTIINSGTPSGGYWYCQGISLLVCSTKCESDSVQCVINGGTWRNLGASTCNGYSCKMSNCLQSDTLWLNNSKATCDAAYGENNYAIVDTNEVCEHRGKCCSMDSILVGNSCIYRCDTIVENCSNKKGNLLLGVLRDTIIDDQDSTFYNKCFYNCSYAYNKDSTTSVTDGNITLNAPSQPISEGIKLPNEFSSIRVVKSGLYIYDFLNPDAASYVDSIATAPCSRTLYRCVKSGKYAYFYSDQDVPAGCTNIVKIK